MNGNDIRRLFPNASAGLLAANTELPVITKEGTIQVAALRAEFERDSRDATLGAGEAKGGDSSRVLVRVTSIRRRLIDEDNLCEKYAVDCCRYAGLLHGDGPGQTKIEVRQRKAGKGEEEATLIEIFNPPTK